MTTYQRIYSNNAKTTLASAVNASDTSIIVADASKFTVPGVNQFFSVTLDTGSAVEIIDVYGISGNVFLNCVRGREGTSAQNFLSGTRVENRVTAGTLSDFARLVDRLANISSVDQLATVGNSPSNSYLCASQDDGGTPIVAVANGTKWRFLNHPRVALTGSVASSGTVNTMPLASASSTIPMTTAGSHIIQFTTGNNSGLCRIIQSVNTTTVSWSTALPYAVATSDQYEVYESTAFTVGVLKSNSDDALLFPILLGD
jgi:hypothetical protein